MAPNAATLDSDGDGVADYLERNGYTFDPVAGRFQAWDKNPDVKHWFTDPMQWSTDQDAFSDGMEASGALMDVAVRGPGDDPLVPAYPNIVVQLMGYSVTLNEEISYSEGESLAKGSTWNRETMQTSSMGAELNWEVGVEAKAEFSLTGLTGGSVACHMNVGGALTTTLTSSNAVSVGGSVLDEANWSRARTTNPTDAAHLKLRLKVRNFGTACASNVIPTLTLRIGGINVATFEPGNSQVNLLVPGGVYPPEEGVYWVVDAIDTGAGVTPLALTMEELRALERGAPVSLSVTQLKADVMLAEHAKGWSSAGDVNEYLTRCEAVGANIRVELADGSFAHSLVFADNGPSAPRETLRDALRRIGMGDDGSFPYRDSQGKTRRTQLTGYAFIFDQKTLKDNQWDVTKSPATPPFDGFQITDMVLGPQTSVYAKAPREVSDIGPTIHYANADPQTRTIKVCASDYQAVETVVVVDKDDKPFVGEDGEPLKLAEEIPDSGFYQLVIPDPDYVLEGTEKVVVTNVANQSATQTVNLVYNDKPPQPEAPIINRIDVNMKSKIPRMYANVTSPQPAFPVRWVRVFHPDVGQKGVLEMEAAAEAYKDPCGWEVNLNTIDPAVLSSLKVVAYVAPGVYAEKRWEFDLLRQGTTTLYCVFDWTDTDEWSTEWIDVDTGEIHRTGWKTKALKGSSPWDVTHFCTRAGSGRWRLNFANPYAPSDEDITEIDPAHITRELAARANPPGDTTYERGSVFVFATEELNLVKMRVVEFKDQTKKWPHEWHKRWLAIEYMVYARPGGDEDRKMPEDEQQKQEE